MEPDGGPAITIIGITGKMGTWFAKYFMEKGWHVFGYSRSKEKLEALREALREGGYKDNCTLTTDLEVSLDISSWVLLSVPIPAHDKIIRKVAPLMDKTAVLFDIASVKGSIPMYLKNARKEHGIHVMSIHPLFGPGAVNMVNKNFIIINLEEDGRVVESFKNIIKEDDPTIIETTPEVHDEIIAYTLAVPHFLNLVLAMLLQEGRVDIKKLIEFEGTTFHLQHLISQEVTEQEPFIYGTIQMENPSFNRILDKLALTFETLSTMIRNKDYDSFTGLFLELRKYYAQSIHFKSVMRRFNAAATTSLKILKDEEES
ncbi:MAG: prephenate dehydrogenase/arogenate dehydrogenase family protein [Promethearchaeota archaeon]